MKLLNSNSNISYFPQNLLLLKKTSSKLMDKGAYQDENKKEQTILKHSLQKQNQESQKLNNKRQQEQKLKIDERLKQLQQAISNEINNNPGTYIKKDELLKEYEKIKQKKLLFQTEGIKRELQNLQQEKRNREKKLEQLKQENNKLAREMALLHEKGKSLSIKNQQRPQTDKIKLINIQQIQKYITLVVEDQQITEPYKQLKKIEKIVQNQQKQRQRIKDQIKKRQIQLLRKDFKSQKREETCKEKYKQLQARRRQSSDLRIKYQNLKESKNNNLKYTGLSKIGQQQP